MTPEGSPSDPMRPSGRDLVSVDFDDRVAALTLGRGDARNALSVELCNAIVAALAEIDRHGDARVVLLQGAGPVFCSGADFAAVAGAGGVEFLPAFEKMLESVARFRLPVVAAIQGAALGGGLQLATTCDFRIAADAAKIGIPSARLGIVVNFENVQRLVLMAGIAVAKDVLMTGRVFTATEALSAGLVTRVVPGDELVQATREVCETLAANAPLSVQGAKQAIQVVVDDLAAARRRDPDRADAIDRLVVQAYNSGDLAEGIRALQEKREPDFEGR